MLPTPDTSHVSFDTIYEPSEDSYLFLDTLSSASESAWLMSRFSPSSSPSSPSPLLLEVGSGSGVVLAFLTANSPLILGRSDVLALATDVNRTACVATQKTVAKAVGERQGPGTELGNRDKDAPNLISLSAITGDLCTPIRAGSVDVLLFNPPYVPTEELPTLPTHSTSEGNQELSRSAKFERDSYYLSLTYAGGHDGMETTDRLLDSIPDVLDPHRGVAYVLLCAQNRPAEVKERIAGWGGGWRAETVGNSGVQAGWEKLVIVRIWRESSE